MKITEEQLREIYPHCRYPEEWARPLSQAFDKFELNSPVRIAAFLGQVGVESAELNKIEENLIYSPQRIQAVWPSRFPTVEDALLYGRNPEKLANNVYANRLGNGPEKSGDGFRYRGRGILQITGKDNYALIGRLINLPSLVQRPDFLIDKKHAAASGCAFWQHNRLNDLADTIADNDLKARVKMITKKVNGGTHGLDKRIDFTERALFVLDEDFDA